MHEWKARWRVDTEEVFTTETNVLALDTAVLSEAALIIETDLKNGTLISLERIDV